MSTTTNSPSAANVASTGAAQFVVPVVGALAMDASATMVTLNELSVSLDYDDKYTIPLTAEDSEILRTSIVLDGSGAGFSATLENTGDRFTNLMKKIIDTATKVDEGVGSTPAAVTYGAGLTLAAELSQALKDRFDEYFRNSLSSILENVEMHSSVGSQAGAEDMAGKLDANACEIIAQQIPKAAYAAWSDASENFVGKGGLPLRNDDTLVFVFNIASTLTVDRQDQRTAGTTADTKPASAGAGDSVAQNGSRYAVDNNKNPAVSTYIYESRRIAFFVSVQGITPSAGGA